MNSSPFVGAWVRRALAGTFCCAAAIGGSQGVLAQGYISNTPSVFVDMGVLEALGPPRETTLLSGSTTPLPAPTAPVSSRGLQDPPASPPVSRLNVPTPTSPVRPTRPAAAPAPAVASAPPAQIEAPKPPAAPDPAPDVHTAARPPAPEAPTTPPEPVKPPAAASQIEIPSSAPAQADIQLPTQVPEPPRPPAAPPVSARAAEPAIEAPAPTAETPPARPAPQVAALPQAQEELELRVEFESGSARLPDDARQPLQQLVNQIDGDPDMRVQLRAYAGGSAETSSLARRLSLSRALAVRSYLIEQGVRSTRMDVRALGNKAGEGPPDRVDIVLVDQ